MSTVSLQWSDVPLWPDDASGGYVHRLAVPSGAPGRDLARVLLAWAERETSGRGRSFLRLDCVSDNPRLRRYYELLGFTYRGDQPTGMFCASLLEKRTV